MHAIPQHWPEYLIEAACLGVFMVSAAGCATLLQHPASPLLSLLPATWWLATPFVQRIPMGIAMGLTAIAIIYSPPGMRSGAHMNPAVTLSFLRLGKITPSDAVWYIAAQFVGGTMGIVVAIWVFGGWPAHPSVNYVATAPGTTGPAVAFLAEVTMAFAMMSTVLGLSSSPLLARYTGLGAGLLVALFIVIEAPLSGMSLNPARTLAPNLLAGFGATMWIYLTAPILGMLLAAERFARHPAGGFAGCAKLHHPPHIPCIHCGHRGPRRSHARAPERKREPA